MMSADLTNSCSSDEDFMKEWDFIDKANNLAASNSDGESSIEIIEREVLDESSTSGDESDTGHLPIPQTNLNDEEILSSDQDIYADELSQQYQVRPSLVSVAAIIVVVCIDIISRGIIMGELSVADTRTYLKNSDIPQLEVHRMIDSLEQKVIPVFDSVNELINLVHSISSVNYTTYKLEIPDFASNENFANARNNDERLKLFRGIIGNGETIPEHFLNNNNNNNDNGKYYRLLMNKEAFHRSVEKYARFINTQLNQIIAANDFIVNFLSTELKNSLSSTNHHHPSKTIDKEDIDYENLTTNEPIIISSSNNNNNKLFKDENDNNFVASSLSSSSSSSSSSVAEQNSFYLINVQHDDAIEIRPEENNNNNDDEYPKKLIKTGDRKLLTSKSEIINNKKGETRRKISSFQKSYDKFDKHYYDDNKEKTNIQKKCLKSLNKHFVKFGKHRELHDEIEDYSKFGCPDDVIAEILLNNDDEIFIKTERLHETYDGKKFKRDVNNNNNNKPVVDRSKICQQQQYVSNDLNDENKNSIIKNSNFNSPSKTIDSPNGNSYYWNKFTSLPSPLDSNSASKEEMSMLKQYPFKKYPEKLAQQNEQMAADGKAKTTNFWYSKGNKLIDRVKKMHKKLFSSSWFVDKQDKLKKVSKGISKNLEKVFSKLQKQYYKLMFSA